MLRTFKIVDNKITESTGYDASIFVYISPDDNERRYLIEQLKVDEHTLASSLDPDEPGRLEFEPEHVAMILKRPKHYAAEDEFTFKVLSTGIFLFSDRLVVVIGEDTPLFEGKVFNKVTSILDVTLKLIYRAISHFVEHLKVINQISNELEQQINVSQENKYLLNLFTLEKSLVYYLNAAHSNAALINRLKSATPKIPFTQENLEFLDDTSIENTQCLNQIEIFAQILANLMDARASIISNNLNIRIKALTVLTIVLMIPTMVVSVFSMNVKMPFPHDHPASFWVIAGAAVCPAIITAMLWWYKKW